MRSQIALVPQDVFLFGGSIKENISYGKPGSTDDEIYAAAGKANALEFIERFPARLDTIVGETRNTAFRRSAAKNCHCQGSPQKSAYSDP